MIVFMKKFTIVLFGVIFVALIAGSVQSISADHESGKGIFKNEHEVELVTTENTNYQVYLQTVLRNGDKQLINVTEPTKTAAYIPHEIADYVFDTLMGEKEIITINNIKYEKVQYTFSPTLEQRTEKIYPIFEEFPIEYIVEEDALTQMKKDILDHYRWVLHYCADFSTVGHDGYQCIPIFQAFTVIELVTQTDVVTHQWTILRVLN